MIMFRVSVISLISSSGVLFCLSLFCRMVIVSEMGMFAVSYTHLDVYKRQVYYNVNQTSTLYAAVLTML